MLIYSYSELIGDRKSSAIVQLLRADESITNVMSGHPYYPIIAASGIDSTVKISSPEGVGKSLRSRQCLRDEYQIRSRNDISLQSGLTDAIVTRDMQLSRRCFRRLLGDGSNKVGSVRRAI